MKMIHNALANPPMSCRRKMSEKITMTSQIQQTHAKKMIMVQSTSRNG